MAAAGFSVDALEAFEAALRLTPGHAPITPDSSPEDKRSYRVVTLPNGLTAILVSDPETDRAAASLDVNIGSFSEPNDSLGLAHFLEHMLFMGTQKYPEENSYSLAINNYGGSQNAYTTREHTNYIFDVTKEHLREVLDRFAQFFISPLCLSSAINREVGAVNNENEKNLQSDYWRIAQVSDSSLNAAHPIARFSTGNFQTLRDEPKAAGIDIRERMLTFYHAHYSANLMKLCVCGKESLDVLEQWVAESFADVKNLGIPRPEFLSIPVALTGEHTTTLTRIVPVKNYRSLELEWILPPTHHQYLADPSKLLVHCLAHESSGSLAHELKARSLANGLTAGPIEQNSSYSLARIEVDLTEAGLQAVPEILELCFAYVAMLRASIDTQLDAWRAIWEEVRAVEVMDFRFAEKQDPIWFCESTAARLSFLPAQHVLSGGCLEAFDETALRALATTLADVRSARVRVIAPEFKALEGLVREPWYGTEHTLEHMDAALLARLASPAPVTEFHLPIANPFVATDFALRHTQRTEAEKKAGVMNATPKRSQCQCAHANGATNNSGAAVVTTDAQPPADVFFVADRTFELPKAEVSIQLETGVGSSTPAAVCLAALWSDLVDDALADLNHCAEEAGLHSYSWPAPQGFMLQYKGFSHKLATLAADVVQKMRAVKAVERPEQFKRLKEAMSRKLRQYAKETPLSHARSDSNQLRLDTYWTNGDRLAVFDSLTAADVDRFVDGWFNAGRFIVLANGNITESEVEDLTRLVQAAFPLRELPPSQRHANRCIDLPTSHVHLRRVRTLNPDDTNSACLNVYQIGVADEATEAHMSLVSHILGDALFDQLRTKETLGYLVQGYHSKTAGVLHYHVAVQSSDASPAYLDCRIESFLRWFRDVQLDALVRETPDFLDRNKQAVVLQLTEKDKNVGDEHARMWNEIEARRFEWNRREVLAKEVEKITMESLHAFYDRYLSGQGDASQRRKVSFQYFSAAHEMPERVERETLESLAYGNEKLVLKTPDGAVKVESADAPVATDAAAAATPAAPAEEIFLPPVPVDPRPIRYVDDVVEFKREQRMYPAMF